VVLPVLAYNQVACTQGQITMLKVTYGHMKRQAATSWPFTKISALLARSWKYLAYRRSEWIRNIGLSFNAFKNTASVLSNAVICMSLGF